MKDIIVSLQEQRKVLRTELFNVDRDNANHAAYIKGKVAGIDEALILIGKYGENE